MLLQFVAQTDFCKTLFEDCPSGYRCVIIYSVWGSHTEGVYSAKSSVLAHEDNPIIHYLDGVLHRIGKILAIMTSKYYLD